MTTSRRANRTLLAEEATGLVFQGNETTPIASGHEALTLLEAEAASNLEEGAIRRRLEQPCIVLMPINLPSPTSQMSGQKH